MCSMASTTPSSAAPIGADIFEPYKPTTFDSLPADLKLDPEGRLVPVDVGFVNFNYDLAAFGAGKLPLPQTLRDLTKPEYKGKVVVVKSGDFVARPGVLAGDGGNVR